MLSHKRYRSTFLDLSFIDEDFSMIFKHCIDFYYLTKTNIMASTNMTKIDFMPH